MKQFGLSNQAECAVSLQNTYDADNPVYLLKNLIKRSSCAALMHCRRHVKAIFVLFLRNKGREMNYLRVQQVRKVK